MRSTYGYGDALMLMSRGLARPYTAHSPARADFEEALAMARDAGDPVVIGYTLAHYGTLLRVSPRLSASMATRPGPGRCTRSCSQLPARWVTRTFVPKRTTTWLWMPCPPTTSLQLNRIWQPRCVNSAPWTTSMAWPGAWARSARWPCSA